MASRTEPPPCHLLRLPYELLRPILAELSKQDQISTAKTCVMLWELAYPMAYNRIIVTIRPGLRDSAWQHLASGVGLRYVQHLTISSSCDETDKGRRLKDLVTGTLIAAMRRNQLLSFTSMPPATWKGSIFMKHVVSLIETQGRLQTLGLSGLEGSSNIRLRDHFQPRQVFSHIHELTVNVSYNQTCDREIYEIVKKSPNLRDLHIRFSQDTADAAPQGFPANLNASLSRQSLHSLVTRLTLQGTVFRCLNSALSFPALCALAVLDCEAENYFFVDLSPNSFPQLTALMIKTQGKVGTGTLGVFMQGLRGLRELVVHGLDIWFCGEEFKQHEKSLELLSMNDSRHSCCLPQVGSEAADILEALPALRHLSLSTTSLLGYYPGNLFGENYSNYDSLLGVIANYSHLQTLGLRCALTLMGTPRAHGDRDLAHTDHAAFCEEALGQDAITRLNDGPDTHSTTGLEYLAVSATCKLFPEEANIDSTFHRIHPTGTEKFIFSLKPELAFGEASEMKKQMLDRYSGDGYYFLKDHIDGMMDKSEVYLAYRS